MTATLTIAALTVREAIRRRLVFALAAVTVALVSLSAWGFYRLSHGAAMTSGEIRAALPTAFILFMFMFSFIVALSATAVASPAVSAEIDSGVLQAIVTRPVRRSEVLLGKWLGLAGLLAAYTVIVCGLEAGVVGWISGYLAPDPFAAAAFLFAEGAVLLTLVLLLSTRWSALAAGVMGVALFGITWLAGVVGALGTTFHISAMRTASHVAQYLLPTDACGTRRSITWNRRRTWCSNWLTAVGAAATPSSSQPRRHGNTWPGRHLAHSHPGGRPDQLRAT